MSDFYISAELAKYLSDDADKVFEKIFILEGEDYRLVKTRRTFRFEAGGKGYFAKVHHGIGWKEILKDILQLKLPILGAENEYQAIRHLEKAGVDTMSCAAYGRRGTNPAVQKSFIITDELSGMVSLEDFSQDASFEKIRLKILRTLALNLGKMHRSGLNHRDCYICHFLLDPDAARSGNIKLHVIDLHRAQIRKKVPFRYQVKDVAGILFSSFDLLPTRREILRFIRIYSQNSLSIELRQNIRFWKAVQKTAEKLYQKEFGKKAAEIC